MPVHQDSSIAPDSTLSTSLPTTPIVVKRSTRVYGRSRPTEPVGDDSLLQSAKSSSSNGSIYITAPQDTDEEIPPSSDPLLFESSIFGHVDDDDPQDNGHDAPPSFKFLWQKGLKEMDEDSGSDVDMEDITEGESASKERVELGHATASLSPRNLGSPKVPSFQTSSADTGKNALSPSLNLTRGSFIRTPSQPVPSRLRHKKPVIHDSDSEGGEGKTSPSNPHPITTPKEVSSPTPPTSEDGMFITQKRDVKGKGKSKAPVHRDVPPLLFDADPASMSSKARKAKDAGSKHHRIKPPTKKDLKETARTRSRITADQQVSIPRLETQTASKHSVTSFFAGLTTKAANPVAKVPVTETDPIADFSSERHTSPVTPHAHLVAPPPPSPNSRPSPLKVMDSLSDMDDEDLPEVGSWNAEKRKQKLLDKKEALMRQATHKLTDSDEDDELQVVHMSDMQAAIKEEEAERRSRRKPRVSEGRKRQILLGGVGPKAQKAKANPPKINDLDLLRWNDMQRGKKGEHHLTQAELNRIISAQAEAKRLEAVRAKDEEWIKRGGMLKHSGDGATSTIQEAKKLYAEKGRSLPEGKAAMVGPEEDDASEDEDWSPELGMQLRGSASPFGADSSDDEETADEKEAGVSIVDEEDETVPLKPRRSLLKAVLDSDDDDDAAPTRIVGDDDLLAPAPREYMSLSEDPTEDEGDKENENSRMWDHGEDKENTAVVRHTPLDENAHLDARKSSLFGLNSSQLFESPGSHNALDKDGNNENDDPFSSPSRSSKFPTSFETRLKMSSPAAGQSSATPSVLKPFISTGSLGFSQFPDDEPLAAAGPLPLQASFSDLFETGTEKDNASVLIKRRPDDLGGSFKISPPNKLIRAGTLDLTQDVALQPAFEVSGTLLRKAEQIFEKEQEYVVEVATTKPHTEPELYVDDHGFLTQTKPETSTPEVYKHSSPTRPKSTIRYPLRTLSFLDDHESVAPLSRLHKRSTTPISPSQGYKSSPSPSLVAKRPVNAFDLMKHASMTSASKRKQNPLDKSEFIEEEAQESDEDEMFGFGSRINKNDEEEEGEDLDKVLESLVDDADMDDEVVGADRVKEKFMEHEKEDDEALQKLHHAAVRGELRRKRRNDHLGLGESDDESDEDERNSRIRRGMKKQKIERDNIKALGKQEETKSFFNVYEENLAPDDTDFAYLQGSQQLDVDMVDADELVNDEASRKTITSAEVNRLARQIAQKTRSEAEPKAQNYLDVSWVDDNLSDEEGALPVKSLIPKMAKQPADRRADHTDFEADFGAMSMPPPLAVITEYSKGRMQTWAKIEGQSRHSGTTGRNVGGAAVTGHKTKSGGGSLRKGPAAADEVPELRRPPTKEPSFLAKVTADSRTARFS
ncbi:hypothetical protein H0H87_011786 [Tephrocybe sp. NHM501043]|nr:hypothetical protein H0H87_011786 [Tephrocybe sp. NHM501043]